MLYFLIDNTKLSVYSHSNNKQNLTLADKVKFNVPLLKILNESKKLNSVIARSLDELSEKVSLTNSRCSIIIDDSLLSHSIVIKSKKYKNIDEQLKKEMILKWGEIEENLYFISEEKKSPKNIYHNIAIHHFLREKIKLNFNNFGITIDYFVPLSSILTIGLKSSQFATIKKGNNFTFFGNTKKGFMFFRANIFGRKKNFEKIIGLLDIPKIKLNELNKNSLKFIFFNELKIVKYLASYIDKNIPILNFVESNKAQIISGKKKSFVKIFSPSSNNFDFNNLIRNISSGVLSLLFLSLIISFFSQYSFLNIEKEIVVKEVKKVEKTLSLEEKALNDSFTALNNLEKALNSINTLNSFIITDKIFLMDENIVKFDKTLFLGSKNSISINYNELLIKFFEADNNLKFKVFDSKFGGKNAKNLVLKFEKIENISNLTTQIKNFNNVFFRKANFVKQQKSLHLYLTIIDS